MVSPKMRFGYMLMFHNPAIRVSLLLALFLAASTFVLYQDVQLVEALDPESAAIHPKDRPIVEFDTTSGAKLLLDTIFEVQPDGQIELIGHQFREDIPYSGIATPWIWAGKLISFDNRCTQIWKWKSPLIPICKNLN